MAVTDTVVAARIRARVAARGAGKTCCPSEIARGCGTAQPAAMAQVRRVAAALAATGEIVVTQGGQPVDIERANGPVRLGLPAVGNNPPDDGVADTQPPAGLAPGST
ncbi:DUF3253 domain-containing protein [Salinisphaera sp. Q1T1-3]|uniref:DUF3253 domain-containing protein n=1 Tax=Salinisphaera sp. Q1T1-3 TaxID=2321229 RepID=UPI000E7272DF|nr:DUF3253 domain-containing protein [Salinisphaera sp. Q1T1-3]RJS94113.1 DUF3253 domain-containing protein [Salinisphaera sp. Q1T1-3]